jgi:hypothetical protein
MSIYSFIRTGQPSTYLFTEPASPPYPDGWNIKVFDIDEPDAVGVEYPGKDRQVQPLKWWHDKIAKHRKANFDNVDDVAFIGDSITMPTAFIGVRPLLKPRPAAPARAKLKPRPTST